MSASRKLSYFRKMAKFVRLDATSGDPVRAEGALERFRRAIPMIRDLSDADLAKQIRHSDALAVIAGEQGFDDWRDLVSHYDRTAVPASVDEAEQAPPLFETRILVSVLAQDEPYVFESFEGLAYDVIQGECSGKVIAESATPLGLSEFEARCDVHGTDPYFFGSYERAADAEVERQTYEERYQAIMESARHRFPDETIEVIAPDYDTWHDRVHPDWNVWGVYVGPEREACYLVDELLDGTYHFSRQD